MIGESVGNHRILSKIGQGGMGTVYEAQDTQLGRRVAIKILNPSLVSNSKELARFRAEAKVQANLNHPNIVTLHEFEPYKDSYYMVMEFVVGRNLAEIVKAVGALPAHIVVTITKQVLDGLSVAHGRGKMPLLHCPHCLIVEPIPDWLDNLNVANGATLIDLQRHYRCAGELLIPRALAELRIYLRENLWIFQAL